MEGLRLIWIIDLEKLKALITKHPKPLEELLKTK